MAVNDCGQKKYGIAIDIGTTTLAMQLVEKEVIFREDLELIFGKRPFENVEENSINNTNSNIEEDTTDSKNISEKEVN